MTTLLAAMLALVGGAGSGYATGAAGYAADAARVDQRVSEIERRTTRIERGEDGADALRQEVARLAARVDAWRESDVSARATRDAQLEARLTRIEDAIYSRKGSR